MQWTSELAARHSALWGFDRWYRLWWYVWPASLALLICGWICIDKPNGEAPWGTPRPAPIRQNVIPPSPPPPPAVSIQGELTKCFYRQIPPDAALMACTGLIDTGQVRGRQLAAVLTQRGFLQREKQPDRAMADYNAALRAQPDYGEAFDGRAWIYMTRREYDAALEDLNKAIDLLPTTAAGIARYYRGFAYLRLNKYPQALADLNEAQRLQPDNADIYLARGEVGQAQENYDAALRDFDEFSKRAPKDVRGPISRSSVLEAMGRSEEALTALESAVTLEPGNAYAVAERDRLRAERSEGNPPK